MVHQQGGEEQRKVQDGIAESLAREQIAVLAFERPGVGDKNAVEHHRAGQIDQAAHAQHIGQQRHRAEQQGVEQNLCAGELGTMRDRQHGQSGLFVIFHPVKRQRPEMRRRPQKDDEKQQHGVDRDVAAHCRPAQYRRHGARGAANDDVLRRGRFEKDGVNHGIADEGAEGQPHGQRVDLGVEQPHAGGAQHPRKRDDDRRAQFTIGRGPPGGAAHHRIDLLLNQTVERSCSAGHQPDAQRTEQHRLPSRQGGLGEKHADDRAEHDQLHHARLGQRVKLRRNSQGAGGVVENLMIHESLLKQASMLRQGMGRRHFDEGRAERFRRRLLTRGGADAVNPHDEQQHQNG